MNLDQFLFLKIIFIMYLCGKKSTMASNFQPKKSSLNSSFPLLVVLKDSANFP